MLYFVDPRRPNQPGSDWQFEENIILEHPTEGDLVLDILKGHRVGGVEFLGRPLEGTATQRLLPQLRRVLRLPRRQTIGNTRSSNGRLTWPLQTGQELRLRLHRSWPLTG